MIPSSELTKELLSLLSDVPLRDENSTLDYKVIPHNPKQWCEFLKDILGLLNSYQRPDEHRFLVYGVNGKTKTLVGVSSGNPTMLDDSIYQEVLKKIEPFPHVELITIDASLVMNKPEGETLFAAFYIPEDNFGNVYELACDVVDEEAKNPNKPLTHYYKGMSFVRDGSTTRCMCEEDRLRIRETKKAKEASALVIDQAYSSISPFALLVGKWDENNAYDIEMLEHICGCSYSEIVKPIKRCIAQGHHAFEYKRGVWKIVDVEAAVRIGSETLTSSDLTMLESCMIKVLSDIDERYDLPADKRMLANVYRKSGKYSDALKRGCAESLACLSNNTKFASLCAQDEIKEVAAKIVHGVMSNRDWRVFASVSGVLPLLAESSPRSYVAAIELSLKEGGSIADYLQQEEPGVMSQRYGYDLFCGLAAIARMECHFSAAMTSMMSLLGLSPYAEEFIERILLPWFPQTSASPEARMSCGKELAKLADDSSWHILLNLQPNTMTHTFCPYEPKYLPVEPFPESITIKELREVSISYLRDAMLAASADDKRVCELIRRISQFSTAGIVDEFTEWLVSMRGMFDEESAYSIWDSLESEIARQQEFKDSEWSLSDTNLELLVSVKDVYSPDDPELHARRLFSKDDFKLIEITDWEEGLKRLKSRRVAILERIFANNGFSGIKQLCALEGVNRSLVGSMFAACNYADAEYERILSNFALDGQDLEFAKGFVAARYVATNGKFEHDLRPREWPTPMVAEYYASLPCEESVWQCAEEMLGESKTLYWEKVNAFYHAYTDEQLAHFVSSLNAVGRFSDSIHAIGLALHDGRRPNSKIVVEALSGYHFDENASLAVHHIENILVYLESQANDSDELFWLEWKYFDLIEDRKTAFIFVELAAKPQRFAQVFALYRGEIDGNSRCLSDDQKTSIAMRAYQVLHHWQVQPGLDDGQINQELFSAWLEGAFENLDVESLQSANRILGQNLFHSPASPDGLFIDNVAAAYLDSSEDARIGFSMESVNSRGVFTVDYSGKQEDDLADSYDEKAAAAESAGFLSFGATLRSIAADYRREAQWTRDGKWD